MSARAWDDVASSAVAWALAKRSGDQDWISSAERRLLADVDAWDADMAEGQRLTREMLAGLPVAADPE